jgi:hypothetical protein
MNGTKLMNEFNLCTSRSSLVQGVWGRHSVLHRSEGEEGVWGATSPNPGFSNEQLLSLKSVTF